MENKEQHLENLTEIRSIMERSSKFLSLSGLSGIAAGITASLAGAYVYFSIEKDYSDLNLGQSIFSQGLTNEKLIFYVLLAGATLVVSLGLAYYFTRRNAKAKNLAIWDATAKRLLIDMAVPLIIGGLFVLIQLFFYHIVTLAAGTMLVFYGLALFSASKYTVNDTRWLGVGEIVLGLLALVFYGYGLLFWIAGFGILHIIYGSVLYFKYDVEK